jgi:hypothetical protein
VFHLLFPIWVWSGMCLLAISFTASKNSVTLGHLTQARSCGLFSPHLL